MSVCLISSAPPLTPTSPLHQSSTGQASKMAASKTQFIIRQVILDSIPLQNNWCVPWGEGGGEAFVVPPRVLDQK